MGTNVLVVDDDPEMCELLLAALPGRGFSVFTATEPVAAFELFRNTDIDVVLTDLRLGDESGLDLCLRIVEDKPDVPVVVMTAFGSVAAAVGAIRAGAYDFISKPFELEPMALLLERAAEHQDLRDEVRRLREEATTGAAPPEMIGDSPAMRRVFDLVRRVADNDATVLVMGESGTGKELIAQALHRLSSRARRRFVAVNCAALPAELLESELFGHVRGAFTDARRDREGLFVQADGGTLFLDEIAEMPESMQVKLLRALQERRVRPVGGDREISFDARIVAATNRDLEAAVREGRFREDLFYRVNVVQVEVPPLRERDNDVLVLAQHFIEVVGRRINKPVRGLSAPAAAKLVDYNWPGNVRELENCIERGIAVTPYDELGADDLPEKIRTFESQRLGLAQTDPEQLLTLAELERRYIEQVLRAVHDNKTRASEILGVDRRTLYRKLDRYAQPPA